MEFCHMVCPRPSSKSQTKSSSQMQWGAGGFGPVPRARATQISMRLARRRQRGASTGIALRLISFPSRRSTCSLEKFMMSTTVQKLLMENSAGTRGAGGGGRSRDQGPGSTGKRVGPVKLLQSFRGEDGTWLGGAASSAIEVIPTGTARGQRRGQSGGLRLCLSLRFPTTPDPRITLQTPERPGVSFQRGRDLFPPVSGRGNQKVVRDQL